MAIRPIPLALIHSKGLMQYLPTLRLFFESGVSNDYRLREGIVVEFRTNEGPWRTLDESELALHFRFNTEVARWLQRHSIEKNMYLAVAAVNDEQWRLRDEDCQSGHVDPGCSSLRTPYNGKGR